MHAKPAEGDVSPTIDKEVPEQAQEQVEMKRGTEADRRDMFRMGKKQELRVRMPRTNPAFT